MSSSSPVEPDLTAAAQVVATCNSVVQAATRHLASQAERVDTAIDAHQQMAYDLAHAASAVENARAVIDYGNKGPLEARIAVAFVADVAFDVTTRLLGREEEWGVAPGSLDSALPFIRTYRASAYVAGMADELIAASGGPRHLGPDFEMVQDTFRRFAEEQVK